MMKKLFSKKSSVKKEQSQSIGNITSRNILPENALEIALTQHQQGNLAQAEALYRQILAQNPHHADALHFLGILAYQVNDYKTAVVLINQSLAIEPSSYSAYNNLGLAYQSLGQFKEAIESYQKALALYPDFSEAYYNLGNSWQSLNNLTQAIACYRSAVNLQPNYLQAHKHLGITLQVQGDLESAIACYRNALAFAPHDAALYTYLASAFQAQADYNHALECYQKALQFDPGYSEAHSALGLLLLTLGRYEEGWQYYEARYHPHLTGRQSIPPNLNFPKWQGESVTGKSLLVWYEQGLGDEIQFCRYVSALKALGVKHVTWVCKKSLKELFKTLKDLDYVLSQEETELILPHDYWIFSLSLPLLCHTTLNNIPAQIPYLYANPEQIKTIATELEAITEFKIGLCWKGNPLHKNDSNRSPGIAAFSPLFKIAGVKCFNLQPNTRTELIQAAGNSAIDRGHEIDSNSFAEAAALMMNLDLIISCDTSIAHLAGALGKPVWIVLPFSADWRWLTEREDSPWYPNMRLFRQTERGNWQEVFLRVEQALKSLI